MNWILLAQVIYIPLLILVCLRVIYDTQDITKTLAYLLLVIFLPILGVIIYFSFGVNFRKRKIYKKKLIDNEQLEKQMESALIKYSNNVLLDSDSSVKSNKKLVNLVLNENISPLTNKNDVKLLINGEEKFPEVFKAIESATDHIHIEYYIFEDDTIGTRFVELLIKKANEGVKVRFIYDDFGSRSIRKKLIPKLKAAGVETSPFYEIKFFLLASRINYRNHRKIIIIDAKIAFVGGVNVSDKYINKKEFKSKLYWRDTHLKIEGPAIWYLQFLFLCDWNFCAEANVLPSDQLFLPKEKFNTKQDKILQITASGPDSDVPTILFALLQAINLAKKEVLITTPYFIPGESILNALIISAKSGVSIKLLVPGISDSKLVNYAARSYYSDLMSAGVEIYKYQKGFVHAKTLVIDNEIAIVGTANMDIRSFELNFEVNAIVYDKVVADELKTAFFEDLNHSEKIDLETWKNRPQHKQFFEKIARLFSPML
ncbi:cardiolipin synthase [Lacinutrix iliipiscaria]|uniref:Cardiolipin synthase n=1 Tax=Lacinutrix iliipiscaria TaxID=1230532 RepID=A0ABW5WP81_9FLAO